MNKGAKEFVKFLLYTLIGIYILSHMLVLKLLILGWIIKKIVKREIVPKDWIANNKLDEKLEAEFSGEE